ncbi:TPA: phage baseplate upper protein [Staphylococcus aureus]|nr:phage baseplate upper protein [Staphylococcus aureus]
MSNLEKSVAINLENTAHYENISNLDITFRTGESDSSVLLFNIIKNNQPLLLSEENIKARIAIRGKGVMVVAPLEILDPFKGILKFQLPNDVIKRDGSYQAQVSVAELGNSDVVVVERTITFNVEKSLFSKIPSETKLHYIVEFQELEKTIMDRAKAMDEAIKNGEDYASLIEKANMAESNAKLYADDKFNKRYSVIFDGTANGVGSTLYLNESLDQFILLIFYGTFPGGDFTEFGSPFGGGKISLNPSNLPDGDGNGGGVYEFGLTKSSRTSLTISNDVYFDLGSQRGSGANANRGTINKIIGVRK